MNVLFEIENETVIFDDKVSISFTNRITQYLLSDDILIVLIGYKATDKLANENVYGIDVKEKCIKWQIKNDTKNDCPFNYIEVTKIGEIGLRNWCHYAIIVNPQTGEALRRIIDNAK